MENLITCKICGKESSRIYGRHLNRHGITSEEYQKLYPGSPLYSVEDCKKTTINGGKHMKEEKYKKMFSEMIIGEKNPNSKSKTTEEQRKQRSPFSKSFLKYENENDAITFSKKVHENITPEQQSTRIEYWLKKGYNETESKKMLSERQRTFSLKKCIEKYGKELGIEKFNIRQSKWQDSLIKNGNIKCGFSKISQILFYDILNNYEIEEKKNIYFATKNKEYFISEKGKNLVGKKNFYQYDFTDKSNKKIIEYNGDMYHANPTIWKSEDNPHPYRKWLKSKDIWLSDKEKISVANSNGFDVFVVWDSDYRKNPNKVLKECLDFLKSENENEK